MNAKTLGLIREFLTAAGAALIAYGIGTDAIWQEATGGLVALITLIWGVYSNEGAEAWFSLARKVLSSVGGVLALTGVIAPDKAQLFLGLAVSFLSMAWSIFGKGNMEPPPTGTVPLLLLLAAGSFLLPSCAGEYPLTGSVMLRDPATGAKGGLSFQPGKPLSSSVKIPVFGENGEPVGYVDLKSGK